MNRKTVSGIVLMLLLVGMTSLVVSIQQVGSSEPPPTECRRTYGTAGEDFANSMIQTNDGGYVIAGSGFANLVKTDSNGNQQWTNTYGVWATSIVETTDGGYAIAGWTHSFGAGGADACLIKTDSAGNMVWNKTYGGASDDLVGSVVETDEGGYAIAGSSGSAGIWSDAWLIKTDGSGNHQWNKTYGGASNDHASSVVQTNDGGYAIAGYTWSIVAYKDFWLAKVAPTEYTPAVDVTISSPENKTYSADGVPLTFTVSESTLWIGFSFDGQANVTIAGNTTLHGLPDGTHSITVYANDTTGIVGASEMVYFTIETQQEEPFPTWIIAVIVIIAGFGVALLVYFTKVKKTT